MFHNQFDAVDKATPRDRIGRGKISPITIQAPGPQVDAKKKMKMAMNAICALTAEMLSAKLRSGLAGSGCVWLKPTVTPMMATRNWHINMPRAPQKRMVRRPNLSTVQNDNGVEQTLTRVKMSEMRNVLSMAPVDCRKGVE